MSVALPLPVGCGSSCELMDIGIKTDVQPDKLPESINAQLPEGIIIHEAYVPVRKFKEIAWIEIEGVFCYDEQEPLNAAAALYERFSAKSIIISKRTKRGFNNVDIAPFIRDTSFSGNGPVTIKAKLSAQDPSLNPGNLLSALEGDFTGLRPDHTDMTRVEVYDGKMTIFT